MALGAALSMGVVIVASCSFPEVTFTDVTNEGGEGGETEGGKPESSTQDGPLADASSDSSAVLEGSTRDDATAKVPDGSCVPEDCDCDKDHFFRSNCDSGTTPPKYDCDDLDPLRKPDAGFSAVVPDPGQVPYGDWNCDGNVDRAYFVNVTCTGLAATGCMGLPGFTNDPGCGKAADYFECLPVGGVNLGCADKKTDNRIQLCK